MKRKNVFFKAGILLLSLLLLPSLSGCGAASKQGKVVYIRTYGRIVSVSMAFTLEDAVDGVIDNPIFTGSVTVETADGTNVNARWDRRTPPDSGTRVIIWTGGSREDWQVERELSEDDDVTLINGVRIEVEDGGFVAALWDEQELGVPIVRSMGMTVKISPTDDPAIWRVTRIVTEP